MLVGTALLLPIVGARQSRKSTPNANNIEIRISPQQSVTYPIDPRKDFIIEVDNGKVKITNTTK